MISKVFGLVVLTALISGSFLTFLQSQKVIPLILQAEQFEGGPIISYESENIHGNHQHIEEAGHPQPATIEARLIKTWVMNSVICTVWVLSIMIMLLLHKKNRWYDGVSMGLIGFYSLFAAPALGLHPELPGATAAPLEARQFWWLLVAGSSFIGLNMMIYKGKVWVRFVGFTLILIPFVYHPPAAEIFGGSAPFLLAKQFTVYVWLTNLLSWLFTGLLVGWIACKTLDFNKISDHAAI